MPGDGKAEGPALARRHRHPGRERAVLGLVEHVAVEPRLVVVPLWQPPGPRELAPEQVEVVEPLAAEMVVEMVDILSIGGDRDVARLPVRQLIGRRQQQRFHPGRLGIAVPAVLAAVVPQRPTDGVVDRRRAGIGHLDLEHRRRQRGIALVGGNERAPGGELHPARERRVMERHLGYREGPRKRRRLEMRHARQRVAVGAPAEAVEEFPRGRRTGGHALIGAVEDAGIEQLAPGLGLDGEVAVAVEALQPRPVADRPVDQPAAARERQPAGADAAEREGDVAGAVGFVDETRIGLGHLKIHGSGPDA